LLLPVAPPAALLLLTLTLGTLAALASVPIGVTEEVVGVTAADGSGDACRGGGASFLGGMRSLMASNPLASSKDLI